MKKYENPELEIIYFGDGSDDYDILTTSGDLEDPFCGGDKD